MAKKFLAMLGTGNYSKCKYSNGKEVVETRFSQEAIIKMHMGELTEEDEIIIFVTKESKKKNWFNFLNKKVYGLKGDIQSKIKGLPEEDMEKIEAILSKYEGYNDVMEENIGLEQVLNNSFKDVKKIRAIDIEDGKTEEELWDTFDKILNEIKDGDEIVFDITHGLRSIPMQILAVINYAKAIRKNLKIKGIYYGAFEVRTNGIAPVFDLSVYGDILDWTAAANAFVNYGNSNEIYKLCEKYKADEPKKTKGIKEFAEALKVFTNCIETSRGKMVVEDDGKKINKKKSAKKSIKIAAEEVESKFKKMCDMPDEEKEIIKPFEKLFEKIQDKMSDFNFKDNYNYNIGIATINWCLNNNMIQNAYTALDETVKTYLCNKYGIKDNDKFYRDDTVKRAIKEKNKEKNVDEDERKKKEKNEEKELIIKTIPMEIVNLAIKISNSRNDINHFGFRDNALGCDRLEKNLNDLIKEFKAMVKKYKDIDFKTHENDIYEWEGK